MNIEKLDAYMLMAKQMAELSPDAQKKVGAILLSPDGRIVASSYNGFLRGANDKELPKVRPDKYEYIQHAERNLIYNCAFEGIRTKDTTIVCTLSPCLECLRAAFQSGVRVIIFEELYHQFKDRSFYEELKDVKIHVLKFGKYTVLEMESIK